MDRTTNRPNDEAWGPWVVHDGRGCPLPTGTIVEVVIEDRFGFAMREIGCVSGDVRSSWNWRFYPKLKRIIRYRQRKPGGMALLTQALETREAPAPRQRVSAD